MKSEPSLKECKCECHCKLHPNGRRFLHGNFQTIYSCSHCQPIKERISDLEPFEHGQEGTHSACKEMSDKYGGKVQCCECTNHKCVSPSVSGWEKEFEEKFVTTNPFKLLGRTTGVQESEKEVEEVKHWIKLSLQQTFKEGRREAMEEIAKDFKDEPIYDEVTQQSIEAYFEVKLSDLKKEI